MTISMWTSSHQISFRYMCGSREDIGSGEQRNEVKKITSLICITEYLEFKLVLIMK